MYKQHQVVLVATDKAENALILTLQDKALNIYILSEDEKENGFNIPKGSWFYDTRDKTISNSSLAITHFSKKIIASTDKSLTKYLGTDGNGFHESRYLPQIPQSFIEYFITEFNKGNVIDKVNVEYEEYEGKKPFERLLDNPVLKLNQDNTINIKPIKEFWSREEVIAYGKLAFEVGRNYQLTGENNISEIEQNL